MTQKQGTEREAGEGKTERAPVIARLVFVARLLFVVRLFVCMCSSTLCCLYVRETSELSWQACSERCSLPLSLLQRRRHRLEILAWGVIFVYAALLA